MAYTQPDTFFAVTIVQDTTRGFTTKVVRKDTIVFVLAERQDDDGLKLLVHTGPHGAPFQVRADVTDYAERRGALGGATMK